MQKVYDHEEKARAEAERLVARLGAGWEPNVWENMGWHYKAHFKGVIHVMPSRDDTWFCSIGECGMNAHLAPDGIPYLSDPVEVVRLTVAGYKKKWLAKKKVEEALITAGEESTGDTEPSGEILRMRNLLCTAAKKIEALRTDAKHVMQIWDDLYSNQADPEEKAAWDELRDTLSRT